MKLEVYPDRMFLKKAKGLKHIIQVLKVRLRFDTHK